MKHYVGIIHHTCVLLLGSLRPGTRLQRRVRTRRAIAAPLLFPLLRSTRIVKAESSCPMQFSISLPMSWSLPESWISPRTEETSPPEARRVHPRLVLIQRINLAKPVTRLSPYSIVLALLFLQIRHDSRLLTNLTFSPSMLVHHTFSSEPVARIPGRRVPPNVREPNRTVLRGGQFTDGVYEPPYILGETNLAVNSLAWVGRKTLSDT
ncbi:hypothetical protein BJV78DRAFT_860616 [Lactifluus subvellereus]|nr:hypothetical protein BJV78DRAFT_860616 [Lactifluus subvellereus]